MKLGREHIEQFTRGGKNPFKTLNIGKKAQIENWFKIWSPDVVYEIDNDLNIRFNGFLTFRFTNITSLPDNLHIGRFLDLRYTKISSLPDNLHIDEWLDITNTNITSLPDDLYVREWLDITNTNITSLPDDLIVEGTIYKDF